MKLLLFRWVVPSKIWIAATVALTNLIVISIRDNLTIGIGDLFTLIGAFGFAFYLISFVGMTEISDRTR